MQDRRKKGVFWSTAGVLIVASVFAVGCIKLSGCDGQTAGGTGESPGLNGGPSSNDTDDTNTDDTHIGDDGPDGNDVPFPIAGAGKEPIPVPPRPERPPHEPKVILSDAHAKTCLVGVGDHMPAMVLSDVQGNDHELAKLYGEKLTLVVFWDIRHVLAEEQFKRLQRESVDPFTKFGVSVVAVNVGDDAQEVASLAGQFGVECPCLLDQDGTGFGAVAKGKFPRTYVLDAEGKILWFDIEYSHSTARELKNAILYFLRQGEDG